VRLALIGGVGAVLALVIAGCSQGVPASPPRAAAAEVAPVAPAMPQVVVRTEIGFRSERRLMEHWQKHGGEFEGATRADYLRAAQELRDRAAGGPVIELVRSDGVVTRFDRGSGAFLAFDPDGTIRTFFKPSDGEAYFRRQSRRR
jgi:pyocin large subunit-like protein